jgi:nicotinate-nucleotide--dimethylbenzimidazole phosphoribosyltransferase
VAADSVVSLWGRLAELGAWLAAVQDYQPPVPFRRVRVVIFAADHAAAAGTESSHSADQTARLAAEIRAGGTAVNVAARAAGATVRVVDVARGSDPPDSDPPDSDPPDSGRAVAGGRAVADAEVDAGADLLVPGVIGIGNGTGAAALVAGLTDSEPVAVVDRGPGDDAGWARQIGFVRASLLRARGCRHDPVALLDCCGGPAIAALTGLLAQAAQRRTPVVLDGAVAAVAGLLAERLMPGARAWWVAGTRSPEPAQKLALAQLGLIPLLDLSLRAEDGTGALLAVPLLAAAGSVARDGTRGGAGGAGAGGSDDDGDCG